MHQETDTAMAMPYTTLQAMHGAYYAIIVADTLIRHYKGQ
jgi:hypothetical protein